MFWNKVVTRFASLKFLSTKHAYFDSFVYFDSLDAAIKELHRRKSDTVLQEKINKYFHDIGIPDQFAGNPPLVLFRQVASPNIETSRFIIAADGVGMKPLFLEYYQDKFTSNNDWKRSIGRLAFFEGIGKKGGMKITNKMAIDFTANDGKLFSNIRTFWGESVIDFHHRLLSFNYKHIQENNFFDGSDWFKRRGDGAGNYYKQVLALFISNGILLENFVLENKEYEFTKTVFLPIFNQLTKHFGVKPIIVALSPTEIETAEFWFCQNSKTRQNIENLITDYHV